MYRWIRLWPYGAFVAVCATGLFLARPQPGSKSPADRTVHAQSDLEPDMSPEDRLRAARSRAAARCRIVRRLCAHELTLLEAAERFRDLNEAAPEFNWENLRASLPGATDDERCCRQVIHQVEQWLSDEPSRLVVERQRLEQELRDHLRRGTLRLPR
jgi:hypothetical protein